MSNSVTSKFAGLFRGLFRRTDQPESTSANLPDDTRPVVAAAPLPIESLPEPAPVVAPAVKASADEISLPVAPIVAHLPMDLRAKLMSVPTPGLAISLPVDTVVSQLAFGAVKITFGEFRQMVPGLFANTSPEQDVKMVTLPLNEILSRLNPSILARSSSRKVEVDDDIKGPFGAQARGVSFTSQPLKSPAPAPAPVSKPAGDTEFVPLKSRMEPTLPISPLTPASAPINFAPLPAVPPLAPARPPLSPQPTNGNNGHSVPPPAAPKPPSVLPPAAPITFKVSAAPAPVPPAPVPAPAPVAPPAEPAQPTVFAALWDLAEAWPEEVKNEILTTSLANENVPLPGNFLEAGLKKGRVTMHWKQLRTLAKPSSAPSINDGLELELPLKVVAPLFFAAKKNLSAPRKKQTVSDQIPNLFFGFPQAAPEPAVAPRPVVEKKSADSNFYVWGDTNDVPRMEDNALASSVVPQTDFTSRQATPKDLVARAIALPGIAGVLVALPDGLRVASEVPAELNADTLAAFVPQIYERMSQSTKELRMGMLNNVSFTVGNVPWRIYRVNAVYFAAFGRAGESLPAAQLSALAGELDRKKSN